MILTPRRHRAGLVRIASVKSRIRKTVGCFTGAGIEEKRWHRQPPKGHRTRRYRTLCCVLGVVGRGYVLRLIRTDAGGPLSRRAAKSLSAAGERQRATTHSSGKGRVIGCYALAGGVGLVVGLWLGTFIPPALQSSTALYTRSGAFVRACEAAGAEIAKLRRAAFFIDDCSAPVVTPIFGEEGYLIVRRTVEGHADDDGGGRVTYSVKVDGRGVDKWRALEVKRAPSHLTLDASLLPTTRVAVPTSAQR
jgi:hypothetical protein